jgi:3-methylfumaryl-CoA hydratase
VFITVRHDLSTATGAVIEEDQTIVYRGAVSADPAAQAKPGPRPAAPYTQRVEIDPVLLFRYSALTFNGHRIHYDAPYAVEVEHYPGLVVHGPLQATMLLNLAAAAMGDPPRHFSFRGLRPAIAGHLLLCAIPNGPRAMALEVRSPDGNAAMEASAEW